LAASNEIAFVNIATVDPIDFDSYEENRGTGGFILRSPQQRNGRRRHDPFRATLRCEYLFPIVRNY
jgi:hypothetical protein